MTEVLTAAFFTLLQSIALIHLGRLFTASLFREKKLQIESGISGSLGFILCAGLAMLLNIFLPLNDWFSGIFLLLTGALFFTQKSLRITLKEFVIIAILAILLSWIASQGFVKFDTGLYHLPKIQMLSSSNTLLGATHINPRFGFNSLTHFTIAALSLSSLSPTSMFSVVPALHLLVVLSCFNFLLRRKYFINLNLSLFLIIFSLCFFVLGDFLWVEYLGWPNTDWTAATLVFSGAISLLYGEAQKEKSSPYSWLALILFIGSAMAKISYACFPITFLAYFLLTQKKNLWLFLRNKKVFGFFILLFLGFFLQGLASSGCLLFPLNGTCINNFDWTLDASLVKEQKTLITEWARWQGHKVEGPWLTPWLDRLALDPLIKKAPILILAGALAWMLQFFQRPVSTSAQPKLGHSMEALLTASLASLLLWFIGAPDPRFAYGPILLLFALMLTLACRNLNFLKIRVLRYQQGFVLILSFFVLRMTFHYPPTSSLKQIKAQEHYQIPPASSKSFEYAKGKMGYIADKNAQCWLTKFPCFDQKQESLIHRRWAIWNMVSSTKRQNR